MALQKLGGLHCDYTRKKDFMIIIFFYSDFVGKDSVCWWVLGGSYRGSFEVEWDSWRKQGILQMIHYNHLWQSVALELNFNTLFAPWKNSNSCLQSGANILKKPAVPESHPCFSSIQYISNRWQNILNIYCVSGKVWFATSKIHLISYIVINFVYELS